MMRLTFDWDSVGLEDILVQQGFAKLAEDFSNCDVYYRISASGSGIHAILSYKGAMPPTPIEMDAEDALAYRREMVEFGLEDEWRLSGDITRLKRGMPTAQLWEWKNGVQAGEWVKYVE